jgi:hypothetical protein
LWFRLRKERRAACTAMVVVAAEAGEAGAGPAGEKVADTAEAEQRERQLRRTSVGRVVLAPEGGARRRWSGSAAARREAWLIAVAALLALVIAPGAVQVEWLVHSITLATTQHAWTSCDGLLFDEDVLCVVVSSCAAAYTAQLGLMHQAVLASDARHFRRLAKHVVVVSAAAGALSIALCMPALARRRGLGTAAAEYAELAVFAMFFAPYLTFAAGEVLLYGRSAREAAQALAAGLIVALVCVLLGCASGFYLVISEKASGLVGLLINGKHACFAGCVGQ